MGVPGNANALLLASAAGGGAYQITRSLRFDSSASSFLNRTPASASNQQTWTWSAWVKRSALATQQIFFDAYTSQSDTGYLFFGIGADDKLFISGWNTVWKRTTQVFRDPSAWLCLTVAFDVTQATGTNRIKFFVNGTQITTFDTDSAPSQNTNHAINGAYAHNIGRYSQGPSQYFSGYLAECIFLDGIATDPSSFTTTDLTTGQLVPKAYGGSYGTNGFKLSFSDNSTTAALGTDTSGNGNTFSVNNFAVGSNPVYSSYTTASPGFNSSYPATRMFDGTDATEAITNNASGAASITFTPGTAIAYTSGVEVYNATGPSAITATLNGGSPVTLTSNGWNTVASGSGSITSLAMNRSNGAVAVGGIRINGTLLLTDGAGAGNDSLVDTPTSYGTDTGVGGEVRGNYATLNPLLPTLTPTNGNLDTPNSSGQNYSTIAVATGKWYVETTVGPITTGTACGLGVHFNPTAETGANYYNFGAYIGLLYSNDFSRYEGVNSAVSNSVTASSGSILAIRLDLDSGTQTIAYYLNNTLITSSNLPSGKTWFITTRQNNNQSLNFGQRAFVYTAPSGFKALVDTNLPAPVVAKGSSAMDVALFTGNGSSQNVTGLNFAPDFVWAKKRSAADSHLLFDVIRGATVFIGSDTTNGDQTLSSGLTAFNSDGFSWGSYGSGATFVGWAWDAGTSTVTNTAGSITSQVRANATAGFSVVTYSGNSSAGSTFGHGLGVAPQMVFIKIRNGSDNWSCYHASLGNNKLIQLNNTNAAFTSSDFNNTSPTSSVFSLGGGFGNNSSGYNYVAYCFAPVSGYSSFGSYVGNGSSSDGPFVYTGMRPKFLLFKSAGTGDWVIIDATRDTYNVSGYNLYPNDSVGESFNARLDILSNGFKLRSTFTSTNPSGTSVLYAAFAENPFQYARAR